MFMSFDKGNHMSVPETSAEKHMQKPQSPDPQKIKHTHAHTQIRVV